MELILILNQTIIIQRIDTPIEGFMGCRRKLKTFDNPLAIFVKKIQLHVNAVVVITAVHFFFDIHNPVFADETGYVLFMIGRKQSKTAFDPAFKNRALGIV